MRRHPIHLGKPDTFDGLCRAIALRNGLAVRDTKRFLRGTFAAVAALVEQHGRFPVPGFGVFYRKHAKARRVVVPPLADSSGDVVRIPAQTSLGFRAAKAQKRKAKRR